jgi:HlyD family secretion protein
MNIASIQKIKAYVIAHKMISIIGCIVIIFIGYKTYKHFYPTITEIKYVISSATKGTVVSSVTGSGQVSASNQIDIKSKASGDVVNLKPVDGTLIKAGTLIGQIYSKDARDALENAKITYEKFKAEADPVDVTASKSTVAKSYNDAWNTVSTVFLAYPDIVSGMDSLLYSQNGYLKDSNLVLLTSTSRKYRDTAGASFDSANKKYETVLNEYNSLTRSSNPANIKLLIDNTYAMVTAMAEALKNTQNAITYISSHDTTYNPTGTITAGNNVNSWLSSINNHSTSLLSAKNSVIDSESSLTKLTEAADPLDARAQEIALNQKQEAYNDTFIIAPFDGVLAKTDVKNGDSVSSGTSIGSFITKNSVAEISLNEVDASKISIGQKATLTFDAIDDLSISGKVIEVDLIGTVSQGVVTYDVKIGFDTQDDRVKSGMSVNASIATAIAQDVIIVPTAAVKTQNGNSFILTFDNSTPITDSLGVISSVAPITTPIEVGISDDTNIEIRSGITEGDKIVVKTITTNATGVTQAPSIFGATGARTTGGSNAALRSTTAR